MFLSSPLFQLRGWSALPGATSPSLPLRQDCVLAVKVHSHSTSSMSPGFPACVSSPAFLSPLIPAIPSLAASLPFWPRVPGARSQHEQIQRASLKARLAFAVGPLNLMAFATGGTPRAGSRHSFTFNKRLFSYGFPCGSAGKESACNVRDLGSIPGLGRSPGEGKGDPLQYPGLENSTDCSPWGRKEPGTISFFLL